ncbi:MAG: hypothetical protein QM705_02630 [Ancrocorticia sp.]
MASYLKVILRLAAKAGPIALIVARQLAPQIQRILKDNPDAFSAVTGRFGKIAKSRKEGNSPKGLGSRSLILREQVTYLYASANTGEVARQAIAWRNELEAIERALPVIKAMSRRQQIIERRKLAKKLDDLSGQIFAASLIDEVEDAVVVHDGTDDGTTPGSATSGAPTSPSSADSPSLDGETRAS